MPVRKLGLMYSLINPSIMLRMAAELNPNSSNVLFRLPLSVWLSMAVFHKPENAMPVSMELSASNVSIMGMTSLMSVAMSV